MGIGIRTIATLAFVAAVCSCKLPSSTKTPLVVIGHRGNPTVAPENTVASVAAAFAIGCDLAEVDVRLSLDGVPIIMHDETVDRTTNGHGAVADLTLSQLKTLDAGSWKDRRFAGERIPTLAEVLQAAEGRGRLLLDVPVDDMGASIAQVFRQLKLPLAAVVLGSWDAQQRADFVQHLSGATLLLSEGAPTTWDASYFASQKAAGVTIFEIPNWSPQFILDAHKHGMPVYAYTINDEPTMKRLIEAGADGIETDNPELAIRLAREYGVRQ
jgi:glycerophosphoryl diester phosphodiesterase